MGWFVAKLKMAFCCLLVYLEEKTAVTQHAYSPVKTILKDHQEEKKKKVQDVYVVPNLSVSSMLCQNTDTLEKN